LCECVAWHPLWPRLARAAKVRRDLVQAVLYQLEHAPPVPQARDAVTIAEALGHRKTERVERVLEALQAGAVIDAGHQFVGAWGDAIASHRHGDAQRGAIPLIGRNSGDARSVTAEDPGERRRILARARTARWRMRIAAETAANRPDQPAPVAPVAPIVTASPGVTQPSFSFVPDSQPEEERTKTTRASDAERDAEFAALWAIWPMQSRYHDAETVYRQARKDGIGAARIMDCARRYLDELETHRPWQSKMMLVNWLRTKPWRDPILPFRDAPAAVDGGGGALPNGSSTAPAMEHALGAGGDRLLASIGAAAFRTWFRDVTATVEGELARVLAPTGFVAARLRSDYETAIATAFAVSHVQVSVRQQQRAAG
jgi:hypothetical protein